MPKKAQRRTTRTRLTYDRWPLWVSARPGEGAGMSNGKEGARARRGKRVGEAPKKLRIPSAMVNTLTMMRKVGCRRPACGQGVQRGGKLPKMQGCTRVSISPLSMANDPAPDDEGVRFICSSEETTRIQPCARFLRPIDAATPGRSEYAG